MPNHPAGSLYGAVAVKHLFHGWPHFILCFLVRPGSPFLRPDPHLERRRAQGPSRSAVAQAFPKAPSRPGRIFTASSTLACWLVVAMTLSRGARRSRRDVRRTTTLYSVGQETRTMMQSCASVAKLRSGGPILPFGIAAIEHPPDARHLEPSSAPCFHARRIREQSQALLLMTPGEGRGRRERYLLGRDATAQSAAFVRVPRSSSCANRASQLFVPRTIAPAHCPSGT